MLEIRLLGAVELRLNSQQIDAGPARQRTVLAALAADAGRPVPVDALIDRVWGEHPPQRAKPTLYTYLGRLRRVLAPSGQLPLVRRSGGYVLDIEPDAVDLLRFADLTTRARTAPAPAHVAALLREAFELWTGPALPGIDGEWAEGIRHRADREHVTAAIHWADAEITMGNPQGVLGPLADLTRDHPLVEPLIAAHMRALQATGRSAEALACYAETRVRLVDELGADPGPELQQAHRDILLASAPAEAPRVSSSTPCPPRNGAAPTPAQLPANIAGFAGRAAHLARLNKVLGTSAAHPTAVVIFAVWGTAGVGKTALAVHWAHSVADQFPDGQLYVNLRGFNPDGAVMSPSDAIRGFLDALAVPQERIPTDLHAQAALYRTQLSGKRVLIVLDNARDAAQVRPLLPGSASCLVLVTSRNQMPGLIAADGAQPIALDLLTRDEAHELLTRRLGAGRVAAEPAAVQGIITRSAQLPLALAIIAARAATNPGFALQALADEVRDADARLDGFTGSDTATDARAVFSWSYRALSAEAATLFRFLGTHPGPDISTPAAASLAGMSTRNVRPVLAELTRSHLLTEHTIDRFAFHDLLRAYAGELAQLHDTDDDRNTALHRVLDHYLHTAHAADRLLAPYRDPLELAPAQPTVKAAELGDYDTAMAWFTAERRVLISAIERAAAKGFNTHTWQLAWCLAIFFDRRGHWHDRTASHRTALRAAEAAGDRLGQAHACRDLAIGCARLGHYDDADRYAGRSLALFEALGDLSGQASVHPVFARLRAMNGQHGEALVHAQRTLALFTAAGAPSGRALALNEVGWYHAQAGDYQQGLVYCEEALVLQRALSDPRRQADTLDSLGYVHHHLGNFPQALSHYEQALTLFRKLGDRYGQAETLTNIGETHRAGGDYAAAHGAWRRAVVILEQLDHPEAAHVRTKLQELDRSGAQIGGI